MAVCVAIVDKENAPIFLRTIFDGQGDAELKLHYTVHSSLDVIEERINQPTGSRATDLRELYLGLLLSSDEYQVYGYSTNTKVKFILVVSLSNSTLRDQEIRLSFRKLHNVFCQVVSNPFYIPGQSISYKLLDDTVKELLVKA